MAPPYTRPAVTRRRGLAVTGGTFAGVAADDQARWLMLVVRLPAEPSRHRVAVWRELRRLGAVSLQQGTWAVPGGEVFDEGFGHVVETIAAAQGHPVVLAVADEDKSVEQLEALFSEQRARESTDPRSKHDWEELAIEWHMMANLAAGENGEISQIEVT